MWKDETAMFEERQGFEKSRVWRYCEGEIDLFLSIAVDESAVQYRILGSIRHLGKATPVQEHFYTPEQAEDYLKRLGLQAPEGHAAEWFWLNYEQNAKKLSV